MNLPDRAILKAVELLCVPYIWGGDDPDIDSGLDCSGFIGYVFRAVGLLPEGYDNTAQGYLDRWKWATVWKRPPKKPKIEEVPTVYAPFKGCLSFYGRNATQVTHIMLCVSPRACIGAVRGNKWTTTVARARQHKAMITARPIRYRSDLILIANPFKEV